MGIISASDNNGDDGVPVPGTVHLVDLEGTMMAKHAKGAQRDIVLVPAPSSDPDDPVRIRKIVEYCHELTSLSAQLVSFPESSLNSLYVHLYPYGRHRLCCHLLSPGTNLRGHRLDSRRPQLQHGLHVLGLWLGLFVLATARSSVW